MRVDIDLEAASLSHTGRAATRSFVLSELHRVVHGYTLWVDAIEVSVRRLGPEAARPWRVEARVALTDGTGFRVSAQSPHPHSAIDDVVHGVWQRLYEGCTPTARPMPQVA